MGKLSRARNGFLHLFDFVSRRRAVGHNSKCNSHSFHTFHHHPHCPSPLTMVPMQLEKNTLKTAHPSMQVIFTLRTTVFRLPVPPACHVSIRCCCFGLYKTFNFERQALFFKTPVSFFLLPSSPSHTHPGTTPHYSPQSTQRNNSLSHCRELNRCRVSPRLL